MYDAYLADPASVDPAWSAVFRKWGMETGRSTQTTLRPRSLFNPAGGNGSANGSADGSARSAANGQAVHSAGGDPGTAGALVLQHRVDMLVRNYRVRGPHRRPPQPAGRAR